jgi:multiple antibiotic resistance protein
MTGLTSFGNAFLLVYAALFPIVNSVGSAPIFLRLTQGAAASRPALAASVAVNSFLLLLGSMIVGSHVLGFFGITLPIVRVAGGTVVAAFAWKLLHSGEQADDPRGATDEMPASQQPDTFYPLTMPLTVGPGSISVAITLGSQRPPPTASAADWAAATGGALAGLLGIAITIYVSYRFAGDLVVYLGRRGTNIMMRLSAFILFCIGIQIVWNGVTALLNTGS